jgi:hypothetical protein
LIERRKNSSLSGARVLQQEFKRENRGYRYDKARQRRILKAGAISQNTVIGGPAFSFQSVQQYWAQQARSQQNQIAPPEPTFDFTAGVPDLFEPR